VTWRTVAESRRAAKGNASLCHSDPFAKIPAVTARLIQFTDPHLYGDAAGTLRGIATLPALERAIAHALRHHGGADALLLTGDLVQDDAGGYAHIRRLFAGLGMPVHCIAGNHDLPDDLRAALGAAPFQIDGHFDIGSWRVVMLDSSVPGSAAGCLVPATLARLADALAAAPGRPVLVCLHHHPVDMRSQWLDRVGLENRAAFFEVLDRHRNVRAVLWGHVHQELDSSRGRVRLLATPATCAQFLPGSEQFAIDRKPPAYRVLALHDDGGIDTHVEWLPE